MIFNGKLISEFINCLFVLGANPLSKLWKKLIWGQKAYDCVVCKADGTFIVQFDSILERDDSLKHSMVYYDKKPLAMKSWTIGKTITKEEIARIPI